MTKTPANPMTVLRRRLAAVGVNKAYLNTRILPEWWDDEAARNPVGYSEALLYLANRLGLTISSLRGDGDLEFAEVGAKFKKRADTCTNDLKLSKMIAFRAAGVAAQGCRVAPATLPANPEDIRNRIIKSGAKWVTLEALLAYCWDHGIPVLHVGEFPSAAKKMEGLSARVDGRPVIVLSKKTASLSAMAFILAHELGHLALGHLPADLDLILDQSWENNERDDEEIAANRFAAQLLTGLQNPRVGVGDDLYLTGAQLAQAAKDFGAQHGIAPGVVALNYGWTRGCIAVAVAALKILEPEEHAVETVGRNLLARIDEDLIARESYEWLLRLTGVSAQIPA